MFLGELCAYLTLSSPRWSDTITALSTSYRYPLAAVCRAFPPESLSIGQEDMKPALLWNTGSLVMFRHQNCWTQHMVNTWNSRIRLGLGKDRRLLASGGMRAPVSCVRVVCMTHQCFLTSITLRTFPLFILRHFPLSVILLQISWGGLLMTWEWDWAHRSNQ